VPVAGRGTRLFPLTRSQPKEMLPLGRRPTIEYVVDELAAAGIKRVIFVTSAGKRSIEEHLDSKKAAFGRGIRFGYTRQAEPRGLGHAVLCTQAFVGREPLVVALGDCVLGRRGRSDILSRMLACFEKERPSAVIAFEEVPRDHVERYGIAAPRQDGDVFDLADLVEKPRRDQAPSSLAVAARYVFAPEILDALESTEPDHSGEIQLTDAVRRLIRDGRKVMGVRLAPGEPRYDVGSFEGYFRAFVDLALEDEEHGSELRDHLERRRERRDR